MKENMTIFPNGSGFLNSSQTAVVITKTKKIFEKPDAEPKDVETTKGKIKVVPWGEDNNLPQLIIASCEKSTDLSTGLLFNALAGYGEGIIPVRITYDNKGKKTVIPVMDNVEINDFFEYNDINGYLLEQLIDMNYFFNVFPEIILNQDKPGSRKVVELNHKEAAFSRWSEMDKTTGQVKYHLYSNKWVGGTMDKKDVTVTEVLHSRHPIPDLLMRIGRNKRLNGKTKDDKVFRYIVPVSFPTPGRTYYQKPPWYSLIESGWYDFAIAIPEFKKYLIQNGMTIRYIIYLSDDYFPDIFSREGIKDADAQTARIKKEYTDLNKFITGLKNSGKSMVSFYKTNPDGTKRYRFEIKAVENQFKGGEYLEDSGEVSNMIAYTLGVHPSIIGAQPGKNSSFSGTDKRELFTIKQSLLKPIRDRLLRPLYLVKAINKWPADIFFAIPNIELTTLDKNKSGVQTKTP